MTVSIVNAGDDTTIKIIFDTTQIDDKSNIDFYHTNNIKIADPIQLKQDIFKLLKHIKT